MMEAVLLKLWVVLIIQLKTIIVMLILQMVRVYLKRKRLAIRKLNIKQLINIAFFRKSGSVIQKGKNGKKKITKEVIVNENGDITSSKTIKTETVKKAANKVIATKKKN